MPDCVSAEPRSPKHRMARPDMIKTTNCAQFRS
jgi:hypothetical protein